MKWARPLVEEGSNQDHALPRSRCAGFVDAHPVAAGRGAGRRGLRSALTTVVRSITVAAGVFAPGHLGELTRQVPFELVDSVLVQTRATERRLRALPSRVGVYFVLALCLFPGVGYPKVWDKLIAALDTGSVPSVSGKALRDSRRRVGVAPLEALFDVLAGPVARPTTPGVRFGRYRTVSFDGCTSIKVPDTGPNRCWLGKMRAALGVTGYPAVELMTLVETGTRALLGAVFGPPATGETDYARRLLARLGPTAAPWSWPTAASTAQRSSPSSPAPAPSSWSGCADAPATGAGPPRRRLVPVPDRCTDRADHHRRHHRHLRRRHPLHRELPAGHHPG